MSVLLATEGAVPTIPQFVATETAKWVGLDPTWTGADGSVWRLAREDSGVLLLRGGTRGLYAPTHETYRSDSPALAGSRYRGSRTLAREVFWPLLVYSRTSSQAWTDLDRAFWRTLRADTPGTWSVTLPDGTRRSLACRYEAGGDEAQDELPVRTGYATYGVKLTADEDPYWQGDPQTYTFANPVTRFPPYPMPGSRNGYVLWLSRGSTIANAIVPNPGDVDTFPLWRVNGPFTTAQVGVGGRIIDIPFALEAGRTLTLDTRPQAYSARLDDGTDLTGRLGVRREFAPIPAGRSITLSLQMQGAGSVTATITPRYERAW